jgi:hypothetical protein
MDYCERTAGLSRQRYDEIMKELHRVAGVLTGSESEDIGAFCRTLPQSGAVDAMNFIQLGLIGNAAEKAASKVYLDEISKCQMRLRAVAS